MDFAALVAEDPARVTGRDLDTLRSQGLTDTEIAHVAAAACLHRFFGGVLAAIGEDASRAYDGLDEDLRRALAAGQVCDFCGEHF